MASGWYMWWSFLWLWCRTLWSCPFRWCKILWLCPWTWRRTCKLRPFTWLWQKGAWFSGSLQLTWHTYTHLGPTFWEKENSVLNSPIRIRCATLNCSFPHTPNQSGDWQGNDSDWVVLTFSHLTIIKDHFYRVSQNTQTGETMPQLLVDKSHIGNAFPHGSLTPWQVEEVAKT